MTNLHDRTVVKRSILHIIRILGALSFGTSMGYAQSPETVQPQSDQFLPRQLRAHAALPTDTVDVPFEDSTLKDHPSVQVMINGHGPFRLGVETGAPVLVVTPQVANAIGHADDGEGEPFSVDSLTIGTAKFENISTIKTSGALGGMDGLLGLNVYYDLLMILDYNSHRMRFTRGRLPVANGTDILALQTLDNQTFWMECWVNGKKSIALLDTQSDSPFSTISSGVVDNQFLAPPRDEGTFGAGAGIGLNANKVGRLKGTIRLGTMTFQQPDITIYENPNQAVGGTNPNQDGKLSGWIIGWPVLRRFTLTLDQQTRRVRLTSAITSVAPPSNLDLIAQIIDMRDTLGLTSDQVTKLQIIGDSLAKLGETVLKPKEGLTPSEIDTLVQQALTEKRKKRASMLAEVQAVLTPVQWKKVPEDIKTL